MPLGIWRQDDVHTYERRSKDEKELDHYGRSLLHMCNSVGMLIANGVPLWEGTDEFICRKHNGISVIDYMLLLKISIHCVHTFTLGQWKPESDHRVLYISLKYDKKSECIAINHARNDPFLSMNSKRAPMYAAMVKEMLCKMGSSKKMTLECQWEVFKHAICSSAKKCFVVKSGAYKQPTVKRKWFDMECKEAQMCFLKH